ncbi:hypothetical protein RT99_15800, partial [Flavobacterium sp. MEB061]|uniref:hypothetical protein n=1 Tax=Flavobacterium sp. MEB061 TaxID=1587524 RepID=UPI0005ACAEA7
CGRVCRRLSFENPHHSFDGDFLVYNEFFLLPYLHLSVGNNCILGLVFIAGEVEIKERDKIIDFVKSSKRGIIKGFNY